jgi:hypothetical protein
VSLQILALLLAAIILVRNLPLALRPLFAPPRDRRLASAIVPAASVILAAVILVVAMKTLRTPVISWPR